MPEGPSPTLFLVPVFIVVNNGAKTKRLQTKVERAKDTKTQHTPTRVKLSLIVFQFDVQATPDCTKYVLPFGHRLR